MFVVGESSAAGVPYTSAHAFSAFLAQRLQSALPALSVEVVNAAVPGYGSRRMLPVVEDIARHQPDLLILYAGHNELAEPRYYAHLVDMDPRLFRLWEWLAQTRLYRLAAQLPVVGVETERAPPRFDFETLDNPLQMFAVRTEHLEGAYPSQRERDWAENHYRFNVERMVDTMQRAGARVMLVTIGQNFAGWAPGGASHRDGMSAADEAAWDAAVARGTALAASDCTAAIAAYADALAIDDRHAGLHFQLATCLERAGRFDEARAHFLLASDLDRMPHGAPTRFNAVLREVADERGTLFVDAAAALERASSRRHRRRRAVRRPGAPEPGGEPADRRRDRRRPARGRRPVAGRPVAARRSRPGRGRAVRRRPGTPEPGAGGARQRLPARAARRLREHCDRRRAGARPGKSLRAAAARRHGEARGDGARQVTRRPSVDRPTVRRT